MEFIGFLVFVFIGFACGMLYERREWRKATGANRADQVEAVDEAPGGGSGGGGKPGSGAGIHQ